MAAAPGRSIPQATPEAALSLSARDAGRRMARRALGDAGAGCTEAQRTYIHAHEYTTHAHAHINSDMHTHSFIPPFIYKCVCVCE